MPNTIDWIVLKQTVYEELMNEYSNQHFIKCFKYLQIRPSNTIPIPNIMGSNTIPNPSTNRISVIKYNSKYKYCRGKTHGWKQGTKCVSVRYQLSE